MLKGSKPVTNTTVSLESNVLLLVVSKPTDGVQYADGDAVTSKIIPMIIIFLVKFINNFYADVQYKIIVFHISRSVFHLLRSRCEILKKIQRHHVYDGLLNLFVLSGLHPSQKQLSEPYF